MAGESIARRYVRALLELAVEQGQAEAALATLQGLEDLWHELPELRQALSNPQVPPTARRAILLRIVGPEAPETVKRFLGLLVQRSRCDVLASGGTLMGRMLDEARGLRQALVTSALPLKEQEQQRLSAALREALACDVVLRTRVDPEIIGGVAVQVGDLLVDGSIRRRLQAVRQHFQREPTR